MQGGDQPIGLGGHDRAAARALADCAASWPAGYHDLGPRFFEPANTAFWNAVRNERADLYKGFSPWDRISEPKSLRALFLSTGAETPDIVPETRRHRLRSPEDWCRPVLTLIVYSGEQTLATFRSSNQQVRARHQRQDPEGAWPHHPTDALGERR